MATANTFKDYDGKTGKVGSNVYHWMLDLEEKYTGVITEKKIQTVEEIISRGRAGTKLVFSGENGLHSASDFKITD